MKHRRTGEVSDLPHSWSAALLRSRHVAPWCSLSPTTVCVCGGGDAKAGRKRLAAGYSAQGTKAPLRRVRAAYETEQEKMRSRDGL